VVTSLGINELSARRRFHGANWKPAPGDPRALLAQARHTTPATHHAGRGTHHAGAWARTALGRGHA